MAFLYNAGCVRQSCCEDSPNRYITALDLPPYPIHPLCEGRLGTHAGVPQGWVLFHYSSEGLELAVKASRRDKRLYRCALHIIWRGENTRKGSGDYYWVPRIELPVKFKIDLEACETLV